MLQLTSKYVGFLLAAGILYGIQPTIAAEPIQTKADNTDKLAPASNAVNRPQLVASGNLRPGDPQVQLLNKINNQYQCGINVIERETSRADFAHNMVSCLGSLEMKMAQNAMTVSAEDLEQLKALTADFVDEFSDLGNRVTVVENGVRLAQNASTFSTTSKLAGEVIMGLTTFSGDAPNTGNTVFTNRVRLNVDTTFTGKDRLRTRLQSRNTTSLSGAAVTGTNMTRLGYDGDEGNTTNVSLLQYTLPVFDRSKLIVETVGSEFNENMYTFNPLLTSSGSGSISRFGRYNPVYRQSADGAAATLDHRFNDEFTGSIGYAIPSTSQIPSSASNPNNGIFGGSNAVIAQVRYQATPDINLGLAYARSYHAAGRNVSGGTGSSRADNPFGGVPTSANHYNFLASAKVSPGFVLSGWAGLTNANRESGGANADIFNFAVTAAFPDLGSKGNVLGLIVGVPPKVTGGSITTDKDTSLHLEALYKVKVSDNLDITPGVLLITSPEHNSTRGSEFVGTVRTTFKF